MASHVVNNSNRICIQIAQSIEKLKRNNMALTKKNAFEITKEAALLKEATTLDQAKELLKKWGEIIVVKNGVKREIKSIEEAEKFFNS